MICLEKRPTELTGYFEESPMKAHIFQCFPRPSTVCKMRRQLVYLLSERKFSALEQSRQHSRTRGNDGWEGAAWGALAACCRTSSTQCTALPTETAHTPPTLWAPVVACPTPYPRRAANRPPTQPRVHHSQQIAWKQRVPTPAPSEHRHLTSPQQIKALPNECRSLKVGTYPLNAMSADARQQAVSPTCSSAAQHTQRAAQLATTATVTTLPAHSVTARSIPLGSSPILHKSLQELAVHCNAAARSQYRRRGVNARGVPTCALPEVSGDAYCCKSDMSKRAWIGRAAVLTTCSFNLLGEIFFFRGDLLPYR